MTSSPATRARSSSAGPNLFAGYFEDASATNGALDRKGWLHTGDIAVMSEDGAITIVDRQKDLIIVSGFNVFPAEVEQVLESHPLVEEAAVLGVPDDTFGESVRAFVVPVASIWPDGAAAPEGLTTDELAQHCMRYLARVQVPAVGQLRRRAPERHPGQGAPARRRLTGPAHPAGGSTAQFVTECTR